MNRRPHFIIVGLLAAALVGVGLLAIPGAPFYKTPILGLDLQGGLEVTLKAVPEQGVELTEADLDRSVEIMRNRVDKLGVGEQEIRKQEPDQIVIALPGIRDADAAAAVIGKTAKLELYDLQQNLVSPSRDINGFPVAKDSIYALLAGQQSLAARGKATEYYVFDAKKKVVAGPVATREAALNAKVVQDAAPEGQELPKGWRVFGVPEKSVVVTCGVGEVVCPGVNEVNPQKNYFYLLRYDPNAADPDDVVPEMTGADLDLDGTRQDFDPQTGEPVVLMQFTNAGEDKFGDITRDIANRGKLKTNTVGGGQVITENFAIVLDREIKSWPSIDWQQYPNGISGSNGAQITGLDSLDEARDLALVLQTGALPVEFQTLSRTDISATLGADSLEQAWKAAILGLLVVAVFLLAFYRFLGLVAVFGLAIYGAFLYAAILIFNVTLTLPGFAGMVLTLGVAADANIVIFERIKEEARGGKSVRAAIAAGYGKGFAAIVDANVVTAITAMVLFAVATASVKGFALMLLIGTAMSLLTAVAATRAILGLLAGFNWFDNPQFMGATGQVIPKWIQRDFIGRRNTWFAISGVVLVIAAAAIGIRGLNLGIDFQGGTQVTFSTPQPQPLEDVRAQAERIGQADAQIQGRGESTGDSYTSFQLRAETLTPEEQQTLTNGLEQALGVTSVEVRSVSESFGSQIANAAILAIIVSLLLITLYVTIRFQWQFALPVMVALAHDLLITVGIYALLGREVTTATVAAVLTVLGYSMYDTIIILDRVRENIPLMRRASFRMIGNVSLWETIRRSLATTFITLLPVTALLLFGGETLKDFAFALLVGVGSGAYSSIFIAAPLVAVFKEREPEYARRRDDDSVAGSVGGTVVGEAVEAALDEPTPELVPAAAPGEPEPVATGDGAASDARERRRQRRASRPHGRPR